MARTSRKKAPKGNGPTLRGRIDGGIALEGPQINGPVVSQSDIDKLLD